MAVVAKNTKRKNKVECRKKPTVIPIQLSMKRIESMEKRIKELEEKAQECSKKSYNLDAKVRALEEENRELREASENHGGTEIAKSSWSKGH